MRKKLFLSSLAIVLITLFLSLLSVEYVIKRQFSDYVSRSTETAIKDLPERLTTIYESKGYWDTFSLNELGHSLPSGIVIFLKDAEGNPIATIMSPMDMMHGDWRSMMNMDMDMGMGMGMGMNWQQDQSTENWRSKEIDVISSNRIVGRAVVYYPAQTVLMDPADIAFVSEVFRYLLLAGGLALILGIALSWWMSRRLTSPLRRLTHAAHRIGEGHLDERVPISTNDEIGQLASAFNTMTDSLSHQEKLRKQFTADIAHELRTPLTSIRSYIEAFQDGVLPANPENLSSISEEIERLVHLASDLKDLNIAEIGGLELQIEKVDLSILLDKVIRNLHPLIQEKDLTIEWDKPDHEVIINGDEALLTRLFYNLIHNAYKYTPEGGKVSVILPRPESGHQGAKQKPSIDVLIKDTGIGIPEEDLDNIFERFYRTDKSRTRETGGAGIGLALVNQIINLHQGEIKVESELNKGSVFTVSLPVAE